MATGSFPSMLPPIKASNRLPLSFCQLSKGLFLASETWSITVYPLPASGEPSNLDGGILLLERLLYFCSSSPWKWAIVSLSADVPTSHLPSKRVMVISC